MKSPVLDEPERGFLIRRQLYFNFLPSAFSKENDTGNGDARFSQHNSDKYAFGSQLEHHGKQKCQRHLEHPKTKDVDQCGSGYHQRH